MIGQTLVIDTRHLAPDMLLASAELQPAIAGCIHRSGVRLRGRVRAKASGRPGARVQTGDYRRGISLARGTTIGRAGLPVPFSTVFTTSPQGRRLEHGFIGVDSLGRNYNQPAFPHWGPATAEEEPVVTAEIAAETDRIVRSIA